MSVNRKATGSARVVGVGHPPGSESGARVHRLPRNLGGPAVSTEKQPDKGASRSKHPLIHATWSTQASRGETLGDGWYRDAKATERPGMDSRKSERLIVPMNAGNSSQRTRGREGGAETTDP